MELLSEILTCRITQVPQQKFLLPAFYHQLRYQKIWLFQRLRMAIVVEIVENAPFIRNAENAPSYFAEFAFAEVKEARYAMHAEEGSDFGRFQITRFTAQNLANQSPKKPR